MDGVHPWTEVEINPEVESVPNMLSAEEAQYLIWVAQQRYEGWGAILDLGPWLGGSSAALAEGLKRQGSTATVQCFDLFEWRPHYMERSSPRGLVQGQNFMPAFLEETRNYSDWIEAQQMDLLQGRWDGGPIEILFVDAAKSWTLLTAIHRVFGPFLEPGRSRVIHQDFRHPWCHWLPLACDSRPDVWEEVEAVQRGDTVTFRPRIDLVESGVTQTIYEESSFDVAQAVSIFDQRIERATSLNQEKYRMGLLRKACFEGDRALADRLEAELLAKHDSTVGSRADFFEARVRKARESALDEVLKEAIEAGDRRVDEFAEKLDGWAQGHLLRGTLASQRGDTSATLEHLTAALDTDPANLRALLWRAELAARAGHFDLALDDGIAALEHCDVGDSPRAGRAFRVLEVALDGSGSAALATKALTELRDKWHEHVDYRVLEGLVLCAAGDRTAGRGHFDAVLKIDPDNERARQLLERWPPIVR